MSIRVNVDQSFNVNVGNIGNVVNVVGDRRFNEKIKFEINQINEILRDGESPYDFGSSD